MNQGHYDAKQLSRQSCCKRDAGEERNNDNGAGYMLLIRSENEIFQMIILIWILDMLIHSKDQRRHLISFYFFNGLRRM